jgi:glutathione peroxidase
MELSKAHSGLTADSADGPLSTTSAFRRVRRGIFRVIVLGGMLGAVSGITSATAEEGGSGREEISAGSVLDFEAHLLSGKKQSLGDYRGQVLLIVNTASRCGYTPQYDGLETLYEKYRDQGFSVLGFPSNDFGAQEPGTDSEIGAFCKRNYGVEFPMFSKVKVGGEGQHALYGYLTGLPEPVGGPVRWNFQKYLVDRSGRVVSTYPSAVEPLSGELVSSIESLLAEAGTGPASKRAD